MINLYLSHKLKALSFLLIVFVVFLHSKNLEINIGSSSETISEGYNTYIQYVISDGITRIAVPLFFMISGFLFFFGVNSFSLNTYKTKIYKRIKTLLVPYLFWTTFTILFYYILQSFPFSKPFFTKGLIREYSYVDYILRILINPLPYQFWFIRDLMLLVLISPLLFFGIKKIKLVVISLLLYTWFFEFDYIILSNESLLFFTLGSVFGIYKSPLEIKHYKQWVIILTSIWALLILLKSYFYFNTELSTLIRILHKMSIVVGVVWIWVFYDFFYRQIDISKTRTFNLFKFTFFIFAFHEPILTISKKLFYSLIGQTELSSLLIYIFTPILVILIAVCVAYTLNKILPKFYKLITGNR